MGKKRTGRKKFTDTGFYKETCLMPRLDKWGGEDLVASYFDSPAAKWLIKQPAVRTYVFNFVRFKHAILCNFEKNTWYGARSWDDDDLTYRSDYFASVACDLCDEACKMPPLYHTIPGCEFDINKSEVDKWLFQLPEAWVFVFAVAVKNKAIVSFDDGITWVGACSTENTAES